MKQNLKKILAVLLAAVCCLSLLTACQNTQNEDPTPDTHPDASTPSPTGDTATHDLPTLGLRMTLPQALEEQVTQGAVSTILQEIPAEDGSTLLYGCQCWYPTGPAQLSGEGFSLDDLTYAGVLGVYQTELVDSLDALTGCDQHQALGQSADGAYQYYLSLNTSADPALLELLRGVQVTITEMAELSQSYGDEPSHPDYTGAYLGEFTTQDLDGNPITQDIFREHALTMVNVFATWCSPCVQEMPDLEKLYQQMKDKNVGVVGVVMDVLNEKGEIVPEDLERAQQLVQDTGVTYPVIVPDSSYLSGRLTNIEAFPETFFVDKNGIIVGGTYSGSGSLEDWLEVVETELANLAP